MSSAHEDTIAPDDFDPNDEEEREGAARLEAIYAEERTLLHEVYPYPTNEPTDEDED